MTIGICGGGTMGRGIAISCLTAGHAVRIYEISDELASRARTGVEGELRKSVEKGKLDAAKLDGLLAALSSGPDLEALADCDVVIEAIVEKIDVKHDLFKRLEDIVRPDATLATNTSSLSVASLAAPLRNPERFIGLHFFNPAHIMKLVEIVRGPRSAQSVIDAALSFVKGLGKSPVVAKDVPGFIVNRVARNYYNESLRLVTEQVASIEQVDRIMKGAGFKMGPFELMDLIGNDVNVEVTKSVYEQYFHEPRFSPSTMQQTYAQAGLHGRKTGRGFYDYSSGDTKK